MARKAKRPPARPAFSVAEWISLNEAFARLKAALGSRDLAERDLCNALRSGRLPSMVRRLGRDSTETFQHLPRSFWARLTLLETHQGPDALPSIRVSM